jgi:hypothetical protein
MKRLGNQPAVIETAGGTQARYDEGGLDMLRDRSTAPHPTPNATSVEVVEKDLLSASATTSPEQVSDVLEAAPAPQGICAAGWPNVATPSWGVLRPGWLKARKPKGEGRTILSRIHLHLPPH